MEMTKRLQRHQSATRSKWRESAIERQNDKSWLRYSQHIAMLVLDRMDELGLTQKGLAELMGCSQQYISKMLKGRENMSIDTLTKIEETLGIRILEPMMIN